MSQAAAIAFSTFAMEDWRRKGVRVTVIEPGEVDTTLQHEEDRAVMRMLQPGDVADAEADVVVYAVTRPSHVCIPDLHDVLCPT